MPCCSSSAMCASSARRARMPPWMAGCSVLTRPPKISGKPVTSLTERTSMPAPASSAAVPPVEITSTPSVRSPRASVSIPVLSATLSSARMGRSFLAAIALAAHSGRLQPRHDTLADRAQRREDALAGHRDGVERLDMPAIEVAIQRGDRHGVGQVALVPLHDKGEIAQVFAQLPHVCFQFDQALEVFLQLVRPRIYHQHHAVRASEHGDARTLVEHLARHGVEMETHVEAMHGAQVER